MALVAAQGRTVAQIRDALKTEPFYGNSIEELGSFFAHITDLIAMNGCVHNIVAMTAGAARGINAGVATGWLAEYRREGLAITLNFQGQVSIW